MGTSLSTAFTDGTSSDAIQSFFDKLLLVRGTYDLIHTIPMVKKSLAQRNGKTMIWRRYDTLALATTTLTEGTNPAARAKTKTDVSATIALYGDYIEDTDFLVNTQPEAVATENVELQGQQMGETFDQIARDRYATATNIVYANGTSTVTVSQILDRNDLDRIYRLVRVNKAKTFSPAMMASQVEGTGSVMPSYWGLADERVAFDLRHVDGFVSCADYGNYGKKVVGEIGSDKNGIRFLCSPNGYYLAGASGTTIAATDVKNTSSYADIYSLFVVGMNAVASVNLEGSNGGVIRHGFGTSGVADALDLRQTTGWKKYYVDVVLNQAFFGELQCAVSL